MSRKEIGRAKSFCDDGEQWNYMERSASKKEYW